MQSPLFQPFRALGYVTDDVPFAVQRRGREAFVTVSVGKCWQVYNCETLRLVLVGPQLPHNIRALAAKGDLTFAATGSAIEECRRIARTGAYRAGEGIVLQLLCLGDHLLSLHSSGGLRVWRIGSYDKPEHEVQLPGGFAPTCMAHPETYLNKVVIGGSNGRLLLVNFTTGRLVHEFAGINESAVKCIVPSPALDVVGIGFGDGTAVLHNLRTDTKVLQFRNASGVGMSSDVSLINDRSGSRAPGGACTAITFRTGVGVPLMAAGGGAGVVTVWDLEQRRLQTVLREGHDAPLTALHFFAGEPRLMSAGGDNALKQWLFDTADGSGRLLRFRSGHAAPPACLRHYGDGTRLLSAGHDRAFRLFSVIQDQQSRELSQHNTAKRAKRLHVREDDLKLPRVIDLAACQVRERDWCNVITAHEGDPAAYTWLLKNYTLGEHVLRPPRPKAGPASVPDADAPVSCVAISSCGNFGLVGTCGGRVDRYNMQSGIHRGTYSRVGPGGAPLPAHKGAVAAVSLDAANRVLVSAGLDVTLRTWDFRKQKLLGALIWEELERKLFNGALAGELAVGSPVTRMARQPSSALLAIACDDLVIRMFDVEAMSLVRRFKGHADRITDLQVSEDCRWLLSASMDGTLRVWDIPAANTLQVMRLGAPVTALSLSPSTDMLATAHAASRGIYLWSNQLLFGTAADMLPSEVPVDVWLPAVGREAVEDAEVRPAESGPSSDEEDGDDAAMAAAQAQAQAAAQVAAQAPEPAAKPYESTSGAGAPAPLAPHLVTLSLLPRTQWHNLVHLDAIRARSKPIAPPKKPAAAPFFLPTVAGLQGRPAFDTEAATGGEASAGGSRVLGGARSVSAQGTAFTRTLQACADAGDFTSFTALLRSMTPNAIDQELRSMQILEGGDTAEVDRLAQLLDYVDTELLGSCNFEFLQAFLRAVLQTHGEAIMEHPALRQRAVQLEKHLRASWTRFEALLEKTRCMVALLSNQQL